MNIAPAPFDDQLLSPALSPKARALLAAVIAISTDLDLRSVLSRIIESATQLTGAKYGALGVVGTDGDLVEFITTGLDPAIGDLIGDAPRGRGILRVIIDDPEPLRLTDLTAHPASFGFPANHPRMTTFLGMPIRIRGTVFGNLYLTEKHRGLPFTDEDQTLVQALAGAAGHVIENARTYGLSESRRKLLEVSSELTESLQPPVDVGRALQQITTSVRRISKATAAALVQFPHPGDAIIVATDGEAANLIEPFLDEIRGLATGKQDSAHLIDVAMGDYVGIALPLRAHLMESSALVTLFQKRQSPRELGDRELLAAFADQAGLALDRAQAVADRETLAVVSERDRIARELHDVVIQRLFATGLQLHGLRTPGTPPEVRERIDQTIDDLDLTIKEIRATIFSLKRE